jgi:RNA polymerase sigma-70 factor (ECF subfamily)
LQVQLIFEKENLMEAFRSTENVESLSTLGNSNDEMLVMAAKVGEQLAFSELWRRHSTRAFRIAYRIMGNRNDAEDAIQDTWMKAYMYLDTFDGRAKFSTWLTRIAINSSLMILRTQRARSETPLEIEDDETGRIWEIADKTQNVEELYARHERVALLELAISGLRPALRDAIEFRRSQESSVKEVAENAGISISAAKSRLMRARVSLRRSLG